MDEDEAIRRVRNSLKAGLSRAEIVRNFQRRGYKIDYAEALIDKALRWKRNLAFFAVFFVFLAFLTLAYFLADFRAGFAKEHLTPTGGSVAVFKKQVNDSVSSSGVSFGGESEEAKKARRKKTIKTEELITRLLRDIGVQEYLHRSPLLEPPKIVFRLGSESYSSIIDGSIETSRGEVSDADLEFYVDEAAAEQILSEKSPKKMYRMFREGRIRVKKIASDVELFSKGYRNLKNLLF